VPLAVNVVIFAALIYALLSGTSWLSAAVEGWLPDFLDWLKYLLWPLFFVSALLIVFFGFNLAINVVLAPFNGLLAEAVERHLTGCVRASPVGFMPLLAEIPRSLRSELHKLGYALVRAVPLLILLFIPLVNLLASVAWIAFGAWLLAIEYADYPMGNHGLAFPAQRELLASRRWLSLGFGAAVMALLCIPILNFVVVPASVAGATAMWVREFASGAPAPTGSAAAGARSGRKPR
jgi:CysZ protein